jgi:hypothetical protein
VESPPQTLYEQSATSFALPLYLRDKTEVEGRLILDLAEKFISQLLFPSTRLLWLWTKRAGEGAKLNIGDFTDSRWKAAQKKFLSNEFGVLTLRAATPDFPNQDIWFSAHINPLGGVERVAGEWKVTCSIPYLRHLAASPEKVESLLQLAIYAWNGTPGGPAYGYGHIVNSLPRRRWDITAPKPPDALWPWEFSKPPGERVHAVPIAYGGDIELNLAGLYQRGRGIKGAFWANFLSLQYVDMAGGEAALRTKLDGMRVERLDHGGLLIVATDSPLPEDTDATRERFLRLDEALQPAFIAREGMTDTKRDMLSYFYRERPAVR